MTTIFILIYLISLIIHIIVCYKENRERLFYMKDLLKEIQFYMWFPILNTGFLLICMVAIIIWKLCKLLKLGVSDW